MAEKFVSPFLSDVAGEDDDQTQLPLPYNSLLFNDSLDEEVDPKALLELAERADLPLESAVGEEQQQADVSNYHSPTACEPHKDLDDSLVMDDLDESKQPSDISHSEEATGTDGGAETSRLLPANENASLDNDDCKVSPKSDLSSAKEKESSSIVEKKKESTEAPPKATGPKVKPSFGKKKKGFTPPKVAAAEKTSSPSTCQSVSSEQPKSNVEKSKLSKISNKKAVKNSNEEIDDSTKEKSAAKTSKDSTDTALTANGSSTKTSSGEGEQSSESSKKTQGKKEKEKDEKAKEREMKKQEKEEKKKEKERKKAELERQRNEKKLELERKKAEREQKKMEKELKKVEKEQKKSEKQQAKAGKKKQQKKTVDTSSNEDSAKKNEEEPFKEHTDEEKEVEVTQEPVANKVNEEGEYDTGNCEAIVCEGTSEHIDKDGGTEISHVNSEAENSTVSSVDDGEGVESKSGERDQHGEDEKENFPPNGTEITMNDIFIVDDSPDKIPVVVLGRISNNPVESSGHETKKEKNIIKMFTPPKSKKEATTKASHDTAKRKKVDGKKNDGCSKTASKKLKDRKGKKRKTAPESDTDSEPEAKRSKPANYHGPVWVQCDNASCKKWRLLKDCDDPAKVPSSWVCSMNSDPDHNSCSAEEERWSDELGDSQEFVESPYIPGSIVWAKMDGYPWWPAMVEEDPNEETYYEMGYRDDPIPVKYHVVFFDTPVCRGWVSSQHTLSFAGLNDPNKEANVNVAQKHRRSLALGKRQANKALSLNSKERLDTFGFAKRFHDNRMKRRKREREEESPEVIPTQWKKRGASGGRKSSRLTPVGDEESPATSLESGKSEVGGAISGVDQSKEGDINLLSQHEE